MCCNKKKNSKTFFNLLLLNIELHLISMCNGSTKRTKIFLICILDAYSQLPLYYVEIYSGK